LIFIFLFWWQVFSSWKIRFFRFPLPPPNKTKNQKKKKKKKNLKKKKKEKKKKKRGGGGGGGSKKRFLKENIFYQFYLFQGARGREKKKG